MVFVTLVSIVALNNIMWYYTKLAKLYYGVGWIAECDVIGNVMSKEGSALLRAHKRHTVLLSPVYKLEVRKKMQVVDLLVLISQDIKFTCFMQHNEKFPTNTDIFFFPRLTSKGYIL